MRQHSVDAWAPGDGIPKPGKNAFRPSELPKTLLDTRMAAVKSKLQICLARHRREHESKNDRTDLGSLLY